VTFTASWHKIFDANPRIGFLAHARLLTSQMASAPKPGDLARLILNDRIDALVAGVLVCLVSLILLESGLVWWRVLSGRNEASIKESAFVMSRFVGEEA